jgi:small-conductance mechanosensitive channel
MHLSLPVWARKLGLSLVFVLGFLVLLRLLSALSQRLRAGLGGFIRARGKGVVVGRAEILSAATLERWGSSLVTLLHLIALLSIVYGTLVGVLWSLEAPSGIISTITAPVGEALSSAGTALLESIPNVVILAIVLAITRVVARLFRGAMEAVANGRLAIPGLESELVVPTERLGLMLIWVVGLLMAGPYLPGAGSKAFQGVTIFLGVIVSLGSSSVVSNLLSGLTLTYSRAFKEGDRVKVSDTYGDVLSLGVFSTKIRTVTGEEVTVPNAVVQSVAVINFSRFAPHEGAQVHAEITIGYDVPWRKVHELLVAAASTTPTVLASPRPYVLQRALEDDYVRYQINAYTGEPSRLHVTQSELNQAILDAFFAAGVEICSPRFTALRDGNHAAMPKESVPSGYRAPHFRVGAPAPGPPRP